MFEDRLVYRLPSGNVVCVTSERERFVLCDYLKCLWSGEKSVTFTQEWLHKYGVKIANYAR